MNFFRRKKAPAETEASLTAAADSPCCEATPSSGEEENGDDVKKSSAPSSSPSSETKEELTTLLPGLLEDVLSDAGKFSLVAMCALTLLELYSEPENKKFNVDVVKRLVAHLKQPKQVERTALGLLAGQGLTEVVPFAEHLKSEFTDKEKQTISIIPQDLVTLAMSDGVYDARFRVLIRRISAWLEADWEEVENYEKTLVAYLRAEEHELTEEEKKEKEEKAKKRKIKRYALIGIATVGGGTLLGLTGGLAAPLLAAGMGTIIGATGAAALGSTAGVAIIGSLFGAAGAGLGGFKMRKRVGDVEEFDFDILTDGDDLHVTVAITGWLTNEDSECTHPWLNMCHSAEQFCLRFETKYLLDIGNGMDYILTAAVQSAASEALKYTVLSGIIAAITWPAAILAVSSVIDNPWSVCTQRTEAAGKQLAEVLLARQHGQRPVTLVGFSLGARVVFYCLLELARRKNSVGIVQDAVMLGAPVTGSAKTWSKIGNTVAGRVVNGYCRSDWLLKFLYRSASVQINIAGLCPVEWKDRRMVNMDLTSVVSGHLDYKKKLDELLEIVGIKVDTQIREAEEAWEDIPGIEPLAIKDGESEKMMLVEFGGEKAASVGQPEHTTDPLSTTSVGLDFSDEPEEPVLERALPPDGTFEAGSPPGGSVQTAVPPDGNVETGISPDGSLHTEIPPDVPAKSPFPKDGSVHAVMPPDGVMDAKVLLGDGCASSKSWQDSAEKQCTKVEKLEHIPGDSSPTDTAAGITDPTSDVAMATESMDKRCTESPKCASHLTTSETASASESSPPVAVLPSDPILDSIVSSFEVVRTDSTEEQGLVANQVTGLKSTKQEDDAGADSDSSSIELLPDCEEPSAS